ncbi:MAG TPA: energy transducer TonB [Allosphingosinicella sp.]|nr:energy transducer TonB [Allosphingosinicella sp.]
MKLFRNGVLVGLALTIAGAANGAASDDAGEVRIRKAYPPLSIKLREEGTTHYRAQVDGKGRLQSCMITKSSGYARLDEATCDLLIRNGRFKPGMSSDGRGIRTAIDGQMVWKLPDQG